MNYCFSKNNFFNHSVAYVNERCTIKANISKTVRDTKMTRSFIPRNLTEIEAITGCTFACICNNVFRMFSCLQINCQPFYLRQLLKFYQFDWLIEIYLQTEGQGTHHKMVSLQPMSGFSPLFTLMTGLGSGNSRSESYQMFSSFAEKKNLVLR